MVEEDLLNSVFRSCLVTDTTFDNRKTRFLKPKIGWPQLGFGCKINFFTFLGSSYIYTDHISWPRWFMTFSKFWDTLLCVPSCRIRDRPTKSEVTRGGSANLDSTLNQSTVLNDSYQQIVLWIHGDFITLINIGKKVSLSLNPKREWVQDLIIFP